MVGGIVIGITRTSGQTHVHVGDCPHSPRHDQKGHFGQCPNPDTCCVYTDEISLRDGKRIEISIGDSFWWRSGKCMWTPKESRGKPGNRCGVDFDIQLNKLGYSH